MSIGRPLRTRLTERRERFCCDLTGGSPAEARRAQPHAGDSTIPDVPDVRRPRRHPRWGPRAPLRTTHAASPESQPSRTLPQGRLGGRIHCLSGVVVVGGDRSCRAAGEELHGVDQGVDVSAAAGGMSGHENSSAHCRASVRPLGHEVVARRHNSFDPVGSSWTSRAGGSRNPGSLPPRGRLSRRRCRRGWRSDQADHELRSVRAPGNLCRDRGPVRSRSGTSRPVARPNSDRYTKGPPALTLFPLVSAGQASQCDRHRNPAHPHPKTPPPVSTTAKRTRFRTTDDGRRTTKDGNKIRPCSHRPAR